MNPKWMAAVLIFVLFLSFSSFKLNGQAEPRLENIIGRNIEAVRGEKDILAVKNFSFKAGSNRYFVLADGRMKVLTGMMDPVVIVATLITPETVKQNALHNIRMVQGTEKARLQCLARLAGGIFSLAPFKGSLSYAGIKKYGPERHHLVVSRAHGLDITFSVDAETFLIKRMTLEAYSEEEGHFEFSYEFGPPMEANGCQIPSLIFWAPVGAQTSVNPDPQAISEVQFNSPLDERLFEGVDINMGEVSAEPGELKGNVLDIYVSNPERPSFAVVTNWQTRDVEKAGFRSGDKLALDLAGMEYELSFFSSAAEERHISYSVPDARIMTVDPLRGNLYYLYFNLQDREEAGRLKSKLGALLPIQVREKAKKVEDKRIGPPLSIVVDPRVELMSIIFRLAGNNEYNQQAVIPYVEDIRKHFDRFHDHPAVTLAKELQLGYHGPMFLAIYLTPPVELKERVPLDSPGIIDERFAAWMNVHGPKVRAFLEEVRRFVKDTEFMAFFNNHQKLYDLILARAREFVRSEVHLEWFRSYFGNKQEGKFILALAPNNGGPSYGPTFRGADGEIEYYSILGLGHPLLDEDRLPVFGDGHLDVVIHEFCHSFVNPLVDSHIPELRALGKKIFPMVESAMKPQGYGSWETMMYETFVRACVLRYIRAYKGPEAAKEGLQMELAQRFVLVEKIYELLGEYEIQRGRYPSLDSFFSKLVLVLNESVKKPEELAKISQKLEEMSARRREAARKRLEELRAYPGKLPKVLSTVPADGDRNVDPELGEIRIVFDRPMRQNTLFVPVAGTKTIEWTGRAGWESQNTVYWFSVKLEPGTEYGYGLNSEDAQLFTDEKGNPLLPVVIRFKTQSETTGPRIH